ncbi:MAG: type II secretion system protein GspG [Candidatus Nealsonbacteria bacterium]|nr:type II secretion system protein GspG [Candidatus Nealsonbacteria bacterium]
MKKMIRRLFGLKGKNERGFTLVELMVVVAILAVLAGIIFVAITSSSGKARYAAAKTDVEEMQKALEMFTGDLNEFPTRLNKTTADQYTLLFTGMYDGAAQISVTMNDLQAADKSQANYLDLTDFPLANRDNLYSHFSINGREYGKYVGNPENPSHGWHGSYLKLKGTMYDPWGNSYIVTFKSLGDGSYRIFILSAGEDRVLDTDPATATGIDDSDIGITWIGRPK